MAGIPDMLTDIRTTGQGVQMGGQPPMGRPPMGGPPPGQPPMGRPPMGGGIASMGGGQPPMGQPPMGGGQPPMGMEEPPMGMEEPPMEEPMSVEKDAAMLAEATMGRTGGDPEAAAAILQTATQMIMSVGQEDPMMMMGGGPLYREDGGPMYAQEGMPLMDDNETLKQMIMNGLKDVGRASIPGAGKFDRIQRRKDNELTALSNSDMNYQDALDMLVKQRKN